MKKLIILLLVLIVSTQILANSNTQADTVIVTDISNIPVIDGLFDDLCWDYAEWQAIDQVWIPYGDVVDSSDYHGQYKVLWSKSTNLLYFLVEVYDDVYVDGFQFAGSNDSYNYDIVEVFIDHDKSGGLHVFDGTEAAGWGTNSENAFSYHIAMDFPAVDETNTNFWALDWDGVSWSDNYTADYASHLPELALRESDGKYYWEFSLAVYDDTYDSGDPEASRVVMQEEDLIGLSLAYCDNDNPDESPKERDNFFGSVQVPAERYNDHWMNCDDYGTIKLVGEITSVKKLVQQSGSEFNIFPNPSSGKIQYSLRNKKADDLNIKIYNILGQKVLDFTNYKGAGLIQNSINVNSLPSGIYIMAAEIDGQLTAKRFSLFNK